MNKYVSLIIDIEKSRLYKVSDRVELQEYLITCIDKLNILFKKGIVFDVIFSAGDELQGLFADAVTAILYLRMLEMLVKPVRIRAGIGIGELSVKIEGGLSTQQDGPAYHNARKAINRVHELQTQRYMIISDQVEDTLANHLLNSSMALKQQQMYMQNIILLMLEFLYPFVNDNIAMDHYSVVKNLLLEKYNYQIGKPEISATGKSKINSDNIKNQALHNDNLMLMKEQIYIDGRYEDSENTIIKKGMSGNIAEIIGTTRQNIDNIIKRGNSLIIRNMDYVALQYIEKSYGGGAYDL
jgi:hypothetical protein